MNPSSDNTLNIKPLPHASGWGNSTSAATAATEAADAATAARNRIATLGQPQFVPAVGTPAAATQVMPKHAPQPISPAHQAIRHKHTNRYQKLRPVLTALASFLFILAMFKAPVLVTQIKYLTANHPTTITTPDDTNAVATAVSPEPLITIPKINVSAPIIYPTSTANAPNYDPELEHGVVHFPNTAKPGQNGNAVFFGHSSNDWWQPGDYKYIFVLLDKMVPGDTFSINFESKRYIYEVTESKVVEATDVSVLNPTPTATVTLITCWPAGTSLKREIIKAKQISPVPTSSSDGTITPVQPGGQLLPGSSATLIDQLKDWWQRVKDGVSNKPTDANRAPAASTTEATTTSNSTALPGN